MNNSELATSSNDDSSILKLIYEDAESSLKIVREDINGFNTRLSLLLGFDATFIRLIMDLPGYSLCSEGCPSCLLLKLVTLTLVIGSIAFCAFGVFPTPAETVIYPTSQLQKGRGASEVAFRRGVVDARDEMIRSFLKSINRKAERFKCALICLGLAAMAAAIDIAIASSFCS